MDNKRLIEVIGSFPNVYGICWSCMVAVKASQVSLVKTEIENLPKDLKREYEYVSNVVRSISTNFPDYFIFRFIDIASMLGLYKKIRYGIRNTPCILWNGEKLSEGHVEEERIIKRLREKLNIDA